MCLRMCRIGTVRRSVIDFNKENNLHTIDAEPQSAEHLYVPHVENGCRPGANAPSTPSVLEELERKQSY